ncbi:MAG: hypothetical protein HN348_36135, partial [Proteobacteria bacterium]|nr:hypothetical protein [Pseudomonadota bacterium]
WCGGTVPVPADFFPHLNPDDDVHESALVQETPLVRVAWVLTEYATKVDDATFCLGVPPNAISAALAVDIPDPMAPLDSGDTAAPGFEPQGALRYYQEEYGHFLCERATPSPENFVQTVPAEDDGEESR